MHLCLYKALRLAILLGQYTWSVDEMTSRKIENRVLSTDAVSSVVRIRVDVVLLAHAERVDHLAHLLAGRRSDDSLGDLIPPLGPVLAATAIFLPWS